MPDDQRKIAKLLMESFIHSRHCLGRMQHEGACSRRPGEVMVLHFICQHAGDGLPGPMVSEISEKLNVTSPTVTQHIKSLEAKGLVERLVDADDRRVVRVQLTEQGQAFIRRINEGRLNMFVGLVRHLGEEESLRFAETMKKAADYLRQQRELHIRNFHGDGEVGE